MAGRSCSLDTRGLESTDLRIAFYEMKEDVERLEGELDTEREATASSVSEAMSMIRRLQGEKATLAMEASQYKRMVEERMSLAELSLELLEDLNYQKDVEIKNLECELHAYRCKLTSLGCNGIDEDYVRFCDRSQTPSPESIMTFPDLSVKKMSKKSSKQRRDRSVKRDHARGSCSANDAEYQAELHQLKERVELLEREKCNTEPAQAIVVKQENMNFKC